MTDRVFYKHYDNPARCTAARRHLAWLDRLAAGVRLPALRQASAHTLALEHLDGTQPGPQHLTDLAHALGRLHAAAYRRHLHAARLDLPFRTGELVIADFIAPRARVLHEVPVDIAGRPAALYKDANIRNFVLTPDGVAIVDFDTLTLAPFGYDLAKLVVSTVMTYGPLPEPAVAAALDAYNAHLEPLHPLAPCTRPQLDTYAQVHHLLTRKYLHRNGYRFTWPDGQPAPPPADATDPVSASPAGAAPQPHLSRRRGLP